MKHLVHTCNIALIRGTAFELWWDATTISESCGGYPRGWVFREVCFRELISSTFASLPQHNPLPFFLTQKLPPRVTPASVLVPIQFLAAILICVLSSAAIPAAGGSYILRLYAECCSTRTACYKVHQPPLAKKDIKVDSRKIRDDDAKESRSLGSPSETWVQIPVLMHISVKQSNFWQ